MAKYNTDTYEQNGRHYRVEYEYDQDHGEPWKNDDGRGIVSDWTTRPKAPGERLLNDDHGSKRYFDFAGTLEKAKAEGWGVKDGKRENETANQYAVRAVEAEYEFLRAWCNDEWHYCGVIVTLLDDDHQETSYTESLWGVESWDDYPKTVVRELVDEIEARLLRHEHVIPRVDPDADVNWQNDAIQFPRLLAELRAIGLTDYEYRELAVTMDVTREQIDQVLERAETAWQTIKARTK
jgi:hypothetical protein